MKPTEEQIKRATAHANLITMEVASRHRMEFSAALIDQWEAIRPQDDAAKELAQAKADIAELNQRLHERTQAFLSKAPLPEPKLSPREIEKREFNAWVEAAGYANYPDVHKSYLWKAWKAARAK